MPPISMRWTPPHDDDRPNCPYLPGFTTQTYRHTPPQPFGGSKYAKGIREKADRTFLEASTHIELVLAYPPLKTEAPREVELGHLTVLNSIAIGNARGAQVVLCSFQRDGHSEMKAVAKIFDALYYPRTDSLAGRAVDSTYKADGDYSREANAYETLKSKGLTGSFAPEYYGSWTFTISAISRDGHQSDRPVRMVLIEHLEGSSLLNLYVQNDSTNNAESDASHLDEQLRLDVMLRLLHGLVTQRHAGITQKDVAPRNIILVPSPHRGDGLLHSIEPRVVLIDYNNAIIRDKSIRPEGSKWTGKLPVNPAELWWDEAMPVMANWTPKWWSEEDHKKRRRWLLANFTGPAEVNYRPLEEKLDAEISQEPLRDNCDV